MLISGAVLSFAVVKVEGKMSRMSKSSIGGLEESDEEEEEMRCSQESVGSQGSLVREISRAALSSPPKKSRGNDDVTRPTVKQPEFSPLPTETKGKRRQNCLNPAKVQSSALDPFADAFPSVPLVTTVSFTMESSNKAEAEMPQPQKSTSEPTVLTRKIFTEPKKRPAYKHVWSSGGDDNNETGESPKSAAVPSPSVISAGTKPSPTGGIPSRSTQLTRKLKQPVSCLDDAVTSLRCDKKTKSDYMVISNVKQAHQCLESGEALDFEGDVEMLFDNMKESRTNLKLLCKSIHQLADKCLVQSFRNYIKAKEVIPKVVKFLSDVGASKNPELAYCTASVIYILSRDRLGLSVDKTTLKLIVDLMKVDSAQMEKELAANSELRKRKEDLWRTLDQWRAITQLSSPDKVVMFEITQENMTPSLLATESLTFISIRKLEEWFKRELRDMGGLDLIVQMVTNLRVRLSTTDSNCKSLDCLDTLRMIERLLKILEQATFMNKPNQVYLIPLNDFNLLESCVKILSFCQNSLSQLSDENSSAAEPDKNGKPIAVHFDCLTGALKVLCNLTHDNELSCSRLGKHEEFFTSCLSCVVSRPQITESQRFDMLVLGLGLLINSVEHCSANRQYILSAKLSCNFDSPKPSDGREMSAVEALTRVFLHHEMIARKLDEDTDDTIKTEAESISTAPDASHRDVQELQDTVEAALQKAGKHMENSIAASYAALLIGCVIQFDDEQADFVKSLMPSKSLKPMIEMVGKILEFMELTSFAGNTGSKAMAKILETLENLD